MKKKYF